MLTCLPAEPKTERKVGDGGNTSGQADQCLTEDLVTVGGKRIPQKFGIKKCNDVNNSHVNKRYNRTRTRTRTRTHTDTYTHTHTHTHTHTTCTHTTHTQNTKNNNTTTAPVVCRQHKEIRIRRVISQVKPGRVHQGCRRSDRGWRGTVRRRNKARCIAHGEDGQAVVQLGGRGEVRRGGDGLRCQARPQTLLVCVCVCVCVCMGTN